MNAIALNFLLDAPKSQFYDFARVWMGELLKLIAFNIMLIVKT